MGKISLFHTEKYKDLHVQYVNLIVFYSLCVKPVPVWMNTDLISWRELKKDTHEALPQQLSVSLFLVFIAVRLEKLTSHRYVVENGSNVKIALFARMGNSLTAVNQNCPKVDQRSLALYHDFVSVQLVPPAPVT